MRSCIFSIKMNRCLYVLYDLCNHENGFSSFKATKYTLFHRLTAPADSSILCFSLWLLLFRILVMLNFSQTFISYKYKYKYPTIGPFLCKAVMFLKRRGYKSNAAWTCHPCCVFLVQSFSCHSGLPLCLFPSYAVTSRYVCCAWGALIGWYQSCDAGMAACIDAKWK